jgi:hypothetical protein
LHKPEFDVHLFGTVQAFKGSAAVIEALGMPIAPFSKLGSEGIKMNDMLPLQPPCPLRFSPGNVTVIMDHVSSLSVLGAAIESLLMALVNFFNQDPFGKGERLNLAVAFGGAITRFADQEDQSERNDK